VLAVSTCAGSTIHVIGISLDETTTPGDPGSGPRRVRPRASDGSHTTTDHDDIAMGAPSDILTHTGVPHVPLRDCRCCGTSGGCPIATSRSTAPDPTRLGTMKLNATAEMLPITWPGFADIHPLRPSTDRRVPGALPRARSGAVRDHRLRRGVVATQRGSQGELPACSRSAPTTVTAARAPARSASSRDPAHWHQCGERGDGRMNVVVSSVTTTACRLRRPQGQAP